MTQYRAEYRNRIYEALGQNADFGHYRQISAWDQKIDPSQMPCLGVATPREAIARSDYGDRLRTITLQVALKAVVGEDEAELDLICEKAEVAILAALDAHCFAIEPESVAVSIDAGGERRIGTAILEFNVSHYQL